MKSDGTQTATSTELAPFIFGDQPLTLDLLVELARGRRSATLGETARRRMQESADVVAKLHRQNAPVYGVTTSLGASVDTIVPPELSDALSLNLMRFHGCGTGRMLDEHETAAVLAARISSLSQGKSGIRPIVAERLTWMLNARVLPVIPAEGSVGASGDLTPLSYVVATLVGERELQCRGEILPAADMLARYQMEPIPLLAKEALALMNGTSVASAMGALAWHRAARLARASSALTAMVSFAVRGNPTHFDAFVHDARPHLGQVQAAAWIRADLDYDTWNPPDDRRLQDRYSIRCAPHIIGVLVDTLAWSRQWLETELNGVTDNPVVDVARQRVVHGGNFYGGHVSAAMDGLKTAVANVVALMDRQIMVLCNKAENEGLPPNLVGVEGPEACIHNGFKAVTIATSALAAEALKVSMPASVFSRSTELHNQDQVPMAPLAVRDTLRICALGETVAAMLCLACCQAVDLRGVASAPSRAQHVHHAVRTVVPRLVEDRRMDHDIGMVEGMMTQDLIPWGEWDVPAAVRE